MRNAATGFYNQSGLDAATLRTDHRRTLLRRLWSFSATSLAEAQQAKATALESLKTATWRCIVVQTGGISSCRCGGDAELVACARYCRGSSAATKAWTAPKNHRERRVLTFPALRTTASYVSAPAQGAVRDDRNWGLSCIGSQPLPVRRCPNVEAHGARRSTKQRRCAHGKVGLPIVRLSKRGRDSGDREEIFKPDAAFGCRAAAARCIHGPTRRRNKSAHAA